MNRSEATRPADLAGDAEPSDLLERAFARHQHELLGMLYYLVGNAEDARDAFQEAFLKCWRRRESVSQIENLRAWIFRIALNTGRDLRSTPWRRRRRPLPQEESALRGEESQAEEQASRREQLDLVRRALLGLRPEEQEVFLLRQNGQLTYEEIAQSINIPLGTVKTRMRLALGKLPEVLEADDGRRT